MSGHSGEALLFLTRYPSHRRYQVWTWVSCGSRAHMVLLCASGLSVTQARKQPLPWSWPYSTLKSVEGAVLRSEDRNCGQKLPEPP
jgi:hypothetical protein